MRPTTDDSSAGPAPRLSRPASPRTSRRAGGSPAAWRARAERKDATLPARPTQDIAPATPTRARARTRLKKKPHRTVQDHWLWEHPKGSGVWWVRLTVHGKRRKWRVGPKAAARDFRDRVRGEIAEGRFFPERLKKKRPVPLLADWIEDYLARTASTRRDTRGTARYAYVWTHAPETCGKTMAEVTTVMLERYRERRRHAGGGTPRRRSPKVGATTVNKELSFLRAVFNDYLAAQEEADPTATLPANPVRNRLFLEEPAHRTRYLAEDEQERLQAALSPDEWTKVLVALCTGLDRGPQFTLRWDQVDLDARSIQTGRFKGGHRGGRGAILVTSPINDELLAVLRTLPSRLKSEWVFPNAAGTGPLAEYLGPPRIPARAPRGGHSRLPGGRTCGIPTRPG